MAFDWIEFLERYNIPYVRSGPSVSKGNVNIKCPFGCSPDKFKMGLHLKTGWYACWVNGQHRGRAPHRIVMELLGCSYATAEGIIGHRPPPDDMDDAIRLLAEEHELVNEVEVKGLHMPREFKELSAKGAQSRFWHYLRSRGFKDPLHVASRYDLRGCLVGPWSERLIIPVRLRRKLVGWTGRSRFKDADLRYYSLTHRKDTCPEGYKPAPIDIKHTLLLYDRAKSKGGDILFVVEGPFDAIKLDYFAGRHNCHAVALYGTSCSDQQAYLLEDLKDEYRQLVLLLDPGAMQQQMRLQSKYPYLDLLDGRWNDDWEDPGALTESQVGQLVRINLLK